jgi:hypothetical protein
MDNILAEELLLEIEKRCVNATAGPWRASVEGRDHTSGDSLIIRGTAGGDDLYLFPGATASDYDFIANARQDIPILIEEIRRLNREINRLYLER